MSKSPRPLIAGNWKMNGLGRDLDEIGMMVTGFVAELPARLDMAVCTPFTLVREAVRLADAGPLEIGAQDCHPKPSGAHTGDISAEMIADCGAKFVIVGHSERRQDHGEDDAIVRSKAEAVLRAGLTPILCIGETEDERRANATLSVLGKQLEGSLPDEADLVVAYEPVWAIGTGMTASADDVGEAHAFIRKTLTDKFGEAGSLVRILYGGSVKPANAAELLGVPEVNGALVGGASLKSEDFLAIAAACPAP